MTPGPAFYTLAVVAEMLQCSPRYVRQLAREAGLAVSRYGRMSAHPRRLRVFLPREVETLTRARRKAWKVAPRARRVKPFVLGTSPRNLTNVRCP